MRHLAKAFWLLFVLLWSLPGPAAAQSQATTAELNGRVSDTQGGVLPGVTVTARNQATGLAPYDKSMSDDDNERDSGGVQYENGFDLDPEWGPARLDRRHQFNGYVLFFRPLDIDASTGFRFLSGRPFDAAFGRDVNASQGGPDRPYSAPGVPFQRSNALRNEPFKEVSVRLQWAPKLSGTSKKIAVTADFFNIFNWDNIELSTSSTVANYCAGTAPLDCGFGKPTNPNFLSLTDQTPGSATFGPADSDEHPRGSSTGAAGDPLGVLGHRCRTVSPNRRREGPFPTAPRAHTACAEVAHHSSFRGELPINSVRGTPGSGINDASPGRQEDTESDMMAEQQHTVLVVDDDEGVRRVLGQWVERLGYNTKLADSAENAITILESTDVDVAVCDVRMPGADGIWLADRIRERFPEVAVILATGLHEMDPAVTLRPGVVAYVVKPFGLEEIATSIKTGLVWRQNYAPRPALPSALRLIEGGSIDPS